MVITSDKLSAVISVAIMVVNKAGMPLSNQSATAPTMAGPEAPRSVVAVTKIDIILARIATGLSACIAEGKTMPQVMIPTRFNP